jgi:hypothetical protein
MGHHRVMDERGGGRREAGTSLVGLLLVVAVLAGMATVVVASLGENDKVARTVAGVGPTGPGEGVTPAGAGNLPDAASTAACQADVAVLESAMAAAHAVRGTYPVSLSELQTGGFLSEQPARPGVTFTPETVEGKATGRVLVDGLPAAEGCR